MPDLKQARLTSCIDDIRIWVDGPKVRPTLELRGILEQMKLGDKRLGVEYDAYGLTAQNGKRLDSTLDGFFELEDVSLLVSRLRVVKSKQDTGKNLKTLRGNFKHPK